MIIKFFIDRAQKTWRQMLFHVNMKMCVNCPHKLWILSVRQEWVENDELHHLVYHSFNKTQKQFHIIPLLLGNSDIKNAWWWDPSRHYASTL